MNKIIRVLYLIGNSWYSMLNTFPLPMAGVSLSSVSRPFTASVPQFPLLQRRIFGSCSIAQAASSSSAMTLTLTSTSKPKVVVTRELGKNGKLINALVMVPTHSHSLCHGVLKLKFTSGSRFMRFLDITCKFLDSLGFFYFLFWTPKTFYYIGHYFVMESNFLHCVLLSSCMWGEDWVVRLGVWLNVELNPASPFYSFCNLYNI